MCWCKKKREERSQNNFSYNVAVGDFISNFFLYDFLPFCSNQNKPNQTKQKGKIWPKMPVSSALQSCSSVAGDDVEKFIFPAFSLSFQHHTTAYSFFQTFLVHNLSIVWELRKSCSHHVEQVDQNEEISNRFNLPCRAPSQISFE